MSSGFMYTCAVHWCFFLFIDVFSEGFKWLPPVQDPDLQALVDDIPDVLTHVRAQTTNKAYGLAHRRWWMWTFKYPEIRPLPASPLHVILYLVHLDKNAKLYSKFIWRKGYFLRDKNPIPSHPVNVCPDFGASSLFRTSASLFRWYDQCWGPTLGTKAYK